MEAGDRSFSGGVYERMMGADGVRGQMDITWSFN